jgi:hypothetical protein
MNVGHRKHEDEIELWGISAKQKKGPKLAAQGIALASLKGDDKADQHRVGVSHAAKTSCGTFYETRPPRRHFYLSLHGEACYC